jgi:hypothetical protein
MLQRCLNSNANEFEHYGGRGITVCDRWKTSFENFFSDMGERPSRKHSLERIDNEKGYEPGNCRWATKREQLNNKRNNNRVTYRGAQMTMANAVRSAGDIITMNGARARLRNGWSLEEALETPPNPRHFHWKRGYRKTY